LEAIRAAGLEASGSGVRVTDAALLKDWGEVTRRLGVVPAKSEYEHEGRHAITCFNKRFQSWRSVPEAFVRGVQSGGVPGDWSDVLETIRKGPIPCRGGGPWLQRYRAAVKQMYERADRFRASRAAKTEPAQRLAAGTALPPPLQGKKCVTMTMIAVLFVGSMGLYAFPRRVLPDRPLLGAPMGLPGLAYEPVNEMGVMMLFGMVAQRLGFIIESVQAGFPDCQAKMEVEPGRWQHVRIEFEYESRGFREHRHDLRGCDIIVCWRHNWKQCPPELQVLELSKIIG
jgi:hypothetical protein